MKILFMLGCALPGLMAQAAISSPLRPQGGRCFLFDDGHLTCGPEGILGNTSDLAMGTHHSISLDVQRVWTPTTHADRGQRPLSALRCHGQS